MFLPPRGAVGFCMYKGHIWGSLLRGSNRCLAVLRRQWVIIRPESLLFFWSLIIAGGVTYVVIASVLFLQDFAKLLIKTKIKLKNADNLTFPTVTICNRNYWKRSQIVPEHLTQQEKDLVYMWMTDLWLNNANENFDAEDRYNWSDPALKHLTTESGNPAKTTEAYLKSIAHGLNETFNYCGVKGKPLPCDQIIDLVDTDAGYCFQFNNNGNFLTHTPGYSGGVSFVLNTMVAEYYIGPYSYSEGFSVALHDASQVPLMTELSYGISPGQETQFLVQRKEIKRKPPYADGGQADCFDTDNLPNPLHHYSVYSYSACKSECKVSHIIKKCGCKDIFDPPLNGSETCTIQEMIECGITAKNEFTVNAELLQNCKCKSVCHEVRYTAGLSFNRFPSPHWNKESTLCDAECIEQWKENYLIINIYYGEMSYEYLEESIAYTGIDMIANLGGTLGICLGASFLTLIEFIEFGLIKLSLLILKRNARNSVTVFKENKIVY
ncbi:acid-sensing ion channel 1C-like [Watersipora subatra]|uniref:acid-sensing ion channel 1C-like n=1 Tax=Watersipora subatra TaxID=2589382 RepID=UPI00355BE190